MKHNKEINTMKKTLAFALATIITTSASATMVDLSTVIQTMSKEDKQFFAQAVNLTSATENQDIKWKSAKDSWQFTTVFPKMQDGLVCKEYQLSFASGGFASGTMCEVSNQTWRFMEQE
jgi:hypothetical protein